jgi:hypothetical protein
MPWCCYARRPSTAVAAYVVVHVIGLDGDDARPVGEHLRRNAMHVRHGHDALLEVAQLRHPEVSDLGSEVYTSRSTMCGLMSKWIIWVLRPYPGTPGPARRSRRPHAVPPT